MLSRFLIAIFVLLLAVGFWSVTEYNKSDLTLQERYAEPMPRNLPEVFKYLDTHWSYLKMAFFKTKAEDAAVSAEHFGTGLYMRNTWIRGNRNSILVKYFNNLGLYNPDDISSVILLSYHRYLHKKPLNLQDQINKYKAYWKVINDCETKVIAEAVRQYKKHKVDDAIVILMHVDTADQQRKAVTFGCPTPDWKYDPKKDLKVNGTIIEKYNINSPDNVFFKVRIDKMNYPNTTIYGNTVKIGAVVDFTLEYVRIK